MSTSKKFTQLLTVIAFVSGSGLGLYAASARWPVSPPHPREHRAKKPLRKQPEVTTLRPVFTLLLHADHDYQGHRVKAMRAIAEACRMMGTDIMPAGMGRGRGHGLPVGSATPGTGTTTGEKHATTEPEQQPLSDEQLKQAQATVQQVRSGIAGGTQPRVAARLDEAIAEIGIALTVKYLGDAILCLRRQGPADAHRPAFCRFGSRSHGSWAQRVDSGIFPDPHIRREGPGMRSGTPALYERRCFSAVFALLSAGASVRCPVVGLYKRSFSMGRYLGPKVRLSCRLGRRHCRTLPSTTKPEFVAPACTEPAASAYSPELWRPRCAKNSVSRPITDDAGKTVPPLYDRRQKGQGQHRRHPPAASRNPPRQRGAPPRRGPLHLGRPPARLARPRQSQRQKARHPLASPSSKTRSSPSRKKAVKLLLLRKHGNPGRAPSSGVVGIQPCPTRSPFSASSRSRCRSRFRLKSDANKIIEFYR